MSRGVGEFGPIQELIPEWGAVVLALVTQLGDVWFLCVLVGGIYLFDATDRDDAAVIVGFTVAGLALLSALKHLFGLPRPDRPLVPTEALPGLVQPLYEATAMASGYGFPSGHALMTTIVYVGLARRLSIGTRRLRFAVAALVIVAVGFSRIALGVHYLVDVVGGVGLGVAFLAVAERLLARYANERATVALALAILFGTANLAAGTDADGVLLLTTALGAFGGWQLVVLERRRIAAEHRDVAGRGRALAVRVALAGASLAPLLLALGVFRPRSLPGGGAVLGLAVAVFVASPAIRRSRSDPRPP